VCGGVISNKGSQSNYTRTDIKENMNGDRSMSVAEEKLRMIEEIEMVSKEVYRLSSEIDAATDPDVIMQLRKEKMLWITRGNIIKETELLLLKRETTGEILCLINICLCQLILTIPRQNTPRWKGGRSGRCDRKPGSTNKKHGAVGRAA
jgi:hypothetical protein